MGSKVFRGDKEGFKKVFIVESFYVYKKMLSIFSIVLKETNCFSEVMQKV